MSGPRVDGRPHAPDYLTEAQAELWEAVVTAEPPSFFDTPAKQAMLVRWVAHTQQCLDLTRELNSRDVLEKSLEAEWLISQRLKEGKMADDLATKLRLTNQSRYTPRAAASESKHAPRAEPVPWETTPN